MEENETLLTSQQWEKIYRNKYGIIIINPTGWEKNNVIYSFNSERISEEEFKKRLTKSTTRDIQNKKNS
jgi:hypothetical protein